MQGRLPYPTYPRSLILTKFRQGLVVNGAKVYVIALPTDPIDEKVKELNELGKESGGSAIGFVISLQHTKAWNHALIAIQRPMRRLIQGLDWRACIVPQPTREISRCTRFQCWHQT